MIATAIQNTKTDWLGEFPVHWEVLRIKNLFHEMDSRSETGSEELLSVSHYTGVTLKRDSLENEDDHLTNAESLVGYKLVSKNDLVINIMLAWNGSLGISPYNGITSPAYCVYRIKGNNNPEYFGYLFCTNLFKAEFRRNSTGIIDSRLRLYSDKFFSIFSVMPPKPEQDEIVQYIKAQEEKINRFIEKKLRFIELLKEQRQSVTIKAVTRGLNEVKKFKETGIEWIGKVPQNWEIRRLKYVTKSIQTGSTPKSENAEIHFEGGEVNWFTPGDIKDLFIKNSNRKVTQRAIDDGVVTLFKAKSVLVIGIGGTLGRVSMIEVEGGSNQQINSVTFNDEVIPEFGLYFLSSFESILKSISNAATLAILTQSDLKSMLFVLPPLEEQKQIVAHIKSETATIDTAIAKAEREIELIREYKEAMISEAVMGKRK